MKRYITFIGLIILSLGVVGALFYLLLRQDGTSYVTYIKLQVNPSFVIGVNKDENVVFYNALNADAGKYNLSMFQGKSLKDATNVFINKYGKSKENKNVISITVMTKNKDTQKHITSVMEKEIINYDNTYSVLSMEPSLEELERYSNEVQYNLNKTLSEEDLKDISRNIYEQVNNYVLNKVNSLKLDKVKEDKMELITKYQEENYFNDYKLSDIQLENKEIMSKSNYEVEFNLNEENNIEYKIILNLVIDYTKIEEKTTVEEYEFKYELLEDTDEISDLKTSFYVF